MILDNIEAIRTLGRDYGVVRLEVFGSICTEEFDPERSDIDFIVTYPAGYEFGPWLTRFNELQDQLAAVLGQSVDLVMAAAPVMGNERFRREADKTRTVIYDASQPQALRIGPVFAHG